MSRLHVIIKICVHSIKSVIRSIRTIVGIIVALAVVISMSITLWGKKSRFGVMGSEPRIIKPSASKDYLPFLHEHTSLLLTYKRLTMCIPVESRLKALIGI